ncbi:MAG: hypothetical protein E3J78_07660 [Candidatus Cloacimonadota bacterium]|nr:MAG: hypothetical protein E3J78_07660 [Candidatus Cloacimonadota bacterium]
MKKVLLILSVVFLTLIISVFAYGYKSKSGNHGDCDYKGMMGYGMMKGHGGMHGGTDLTMINRYLKGANFYLLHEEELSLSAKQIKALKSIRDDHKKDIIKKRAELEELQLDFDNILSEDNIDLSKAKSLNKKIALFQAELRFWRIETRIKAKKVLSKEQYNKLESIDVDCCGKDGKRGQGMMNR